MSYSFNIPIGTSGNTFSATIDTDTYSCNALEEYLSSPRIQFRYNCVYSGFDPCYVNSDTVASLTPSSYGKVGLSIPQIQSHGIKAYSQPNDYTNSYALFTTVEYANSWGGNPRTQNTAEIPYAGFNWTYGQITGISQWTISTNIPIFATDSDLQTYLTTGAGIEQAVNYIPLPSYFPMDQDDNQKFSTTVINYINQTWDTENKYFLAYMYSETDSVYRYHVGLWDKTSSSNYYGIIQSNGYQFKLYQPTGLSGYVFKDVLRSKSDGHCYQATPSGTF